MESKTFICGTCEKRRPRHMLAQDPAKGLLCGMCKRDEYRRTHPPVLSMPLKELLWLKETSRIVWVGDLKVGTGYTYRNQDGTYPTRLYKTQECDEVPVCEVEVESWEQVDGAYRAAWAKFGLQQYRNKPREVS